MDMASLIGVVLALAVVGGLMGNNAKLFYSTHAFIVVFGGLLGSTFLKFNMKDIFNVASITGKVFFSKVDHPHEIINQLVDMANIARKDGILALEKVKAENHFLQTAINHCVDGVEPEFLQEVLYKEVEYLEARHHTGVILYESMGEAAPAFGMVGTLIGMVEMLANMSDPSSIGPSMATALLATCYGAIVANAFTIPMAIKLHHYSKEERIIYQIIMDGISGIQKGVNPRMLEQMLKAALSRREREL